MLDTLRGIEGVLRLGPGGLAQDDSEEGGLAQDDSEEGGLAQDDSEDKKPRPGPGRRLR